MKTVCEDLSNPGGHVNLEQVATFGNPIQRNDKVWVVDCYGPKGENLGSVSKADFDQFRLEKNK
jgi:hypothetical protein